MDWKTIVWSLFTLMFLLKETHSRQVRILGTDYKDTIKNQYIVAVNTKKLKNDATSYEDVKESTANELKDYLIQNIPNTDSLKLKSLIFPNYVILLVSLEPEYVHLLQEHPMVSIIETNHKVSVYNTNLNFSNPLNFSDSLNVTSSVTLDDRTCLLQDTGKTLWGLSRISSRHRITRLSEYRYVESDGEDVDIYIMDTGIKIEHEDFGGRAIHGFTSPWIEEGPGDLQGHGTHIAGTAGGATYGVAKQSNLISVKILNQYGVGYSWDIISGLEWISRDLATKQAAKGRRAKSVINMSLGGDKDEIQTDVEIAMLDLASEFGVVFVVAAGNSNQDACYFSPARLSWAITVAASDDSDVKSTFSNFGPCVDIIAPGSDIESADFNTDDNAIAFSGTSMATPHVSGVVARYLSRLCEMPSPAAVKAWLLNTATQDAIDTVDPNTPNKLLYMPCFWDGSSIESGSVVMQGENDFRYDIILFTLILGFGVLLIFSITAVALGYATFKMAKLNQAIYDVPVKKSNSRKYKVAQSDNVGFVGDDEVDRVPKTDGNMTTGSECNNSIAVITQDLNHDNP